jgi:hypothetical protein
MRKLFFASTLSTMLFAVSGPIGAQQPQKVAQIGYLLYPRRSC